MPFFLDGNPTQSEISEAVNYLLANFSQSVSADPNTGQVVGPGGEIQYYLYKYMQVKYANSFDGTVGFSNFPTGCSYYGLRNTDDTTESTNPADYVWTKASPAFGTTYFLYYLTTGGRAIQFQIATSTPNSGWLIDPGVPIDLDITTKTNAVANFVVIRVPNNFAAPTDAECISAIGRTPINGDLCTINYNSGIGSIVYKYTTGWAVFQKYITSDIVEAQYLSAFTANLGTVTAGEVIIGSSPTISGTTMTGSGSHIYTDGRFITGNSSKNLVFDGTNLNVNGSIIATGNIINDAVTVFSLQDVNRTGITSGTYSETFSVSVSAACTVSAIGVIQPFGSGTPTSYFNATITNGSSIFTGGVISIGVKTLSSITTTTGATTVNVTVNGTYDNTSINGYQLYVSFFVRYK